MSKIRIKVHKTVTLDGKRIVKILSIECKTREELPDLYFHQHQEPYCFYDKDNSQLFVYTYGTITGDKNKIYKIGDILEECYFDWLLRDLKDCSYQLQQTNILIKREAQKNKKWNGIFNFTY
jgi:hypothetical protein